ncbi:MAG: M15 family metallopeptidase [Pseudomonadota bacterium]
MKGNKIINIADPRVLKVPILESNDILVDLREQDELAYGPVPESPLTKNHYTFVRKRVYENLCQAQKSLPSGWHFRVYESFRSSKIQQMLFEQQYQKVLQKFPDKEREEIFYETTSLVSPVKNLDGTANIPAHNTGAAIDVEIIAKDGELIDMGMAIKDWQKVNPDLCQTDYNLLDHDIMARHDFVNYPTEWWHFSY